MTRNDPTGVNVRNGLGGRYEVFLGALRTGYHVRAYNERRALRKAQIIADTLLDQGFHIPTQENKT